MTGRLTRGAVVRVRFDPAEGSEIRKTRPAVVVSNNAACRFDAVIQVVPVTRFPKRDLRPYECQVKSADSGLSKPSRLVANQIRTISKNRVEAILGRLNTVIDEAVEDIAYNEGRNYCRKVVGHLLVYLTLHATVEERRALLPHLVPEPDAVPREFPGVIDF